jgi:hypothetical protein
MNIVLGMITKKLDNSNALLQFVENAEKYGHKLQKAIVTCSNGVDISAVNAIREKISLDIIDLNNPDYLIKEFRRYGVSEKHTQTLLELPLNAESTPVPYGYNRNMVVLQAILSGADILIFVDSDVAPYVLNKSLELEEVDFFGRHLHHLSGETLITTSEYSGYNILPAANFDGMWELLIGLQKEGMSAFWATNSEHHCLTVHEPLEPSETTKVLGGNAGFKLEAFQKIPPFFSSYYTTPEETFLCRGEDTILGPSFKRNQITCIDIQTKIFHDTYRNYPQVPNLQEDTAVQERFYYACTGWVGRNPFYNYIMHKDLTATQELQHFNLQIGSKALAEYTNNYKFLTLPEKLEISWASLPRYVAEYEQLLEAWENFKLKCF